MRGSHDLSKVGQPCFPTAVGYPEVRHHRASGAGLDEDVVWLDIAVHDSASMGVCESPRDFAQDARSVGWREWSLRAKLIAECFAFDVAHDEKNEAIGCANAVNRDDVRMRQSGRGPRLVNEPLARGCEAGEVRWQHLDGDIAIELNIAGEINDSHSSAADLSLEEIFSGERGLELQEFG
jgi:hypothetical protein